MIRKSTSETLFTTKDETFIYSDLYLEVNARVPTNYLFGFGERNSQDLRLKKGEYTLYGRDDPSLLETGRK